MRFPEPETFERADTQTVFCALLWDELFDLSTPDSFQPRLSNSCSLIREIGDAAVRLKSSDRWRKHFDVLRDELQAVAKIEDDLLSKIPYYKWLTQRFSTDRAELLVPLIPVTRDWEGRYLDLVKSTVLESLSKNFSPEVANAMIGRLATAALQAGCYPEEMCEEANDDRFALDPYAFATKLITAISPAEEKMSCCLAVTGDSSEIKSLARKVGFEIVRAKTLEDPTHTAFRNAVKAIRTDGGNPISYVSVAVDASTKWHAAKNAMRLLRTPIDICNFYSEEPRLSIVPIALVRTSGGVYSTTPIGEHQMKRRFPRRARALTMTTMNRVPITNLDGRVLNALEHYALAHSSTAVRVKLVNLWTALESLAGANDSVIGGICDMVAPLVVLRRCDKILTYTATCLNDFRGGSSDLIDPDLLAADGVAVSREKLMLTLARGEKEPSVIKLLAFCAANPLLHYRIRTLSRTFSDSKKLEGELFLSRRRITWHLHRIYRSRNLIVHEGNDTHFTQSLLDSLHYYFSITLSRILHGMQLRKGSSVDESVASWRSRADYLIQTLKAKPRDLRIRDFFVTPSHDAAGLPIW